jgi:hypothetical protein
MEIFYFPARLFFPLDIDSTQISLILILHLAPFFMVDHESSFQQMLLECKSAPSVVPTHAFDMAQAD